MRVWKCGWLATCMLQWYCYTLVGPCPHRDMDYHIGSNFWKFDLIKTNYTLGEPVSLVKVFRLFRLERIFLVFRVWTRYVDVQHLIYWQGQGVCDAFFCLCTNVSGRSVQVLLYSSFDYATNVAGRSVHTLANVIQLMQLSFFHNIYLLICTPYAVFLSCHKIGSCFRV